MRSIIQIIVICALLMQAIAFNLKPGEILNWDTDSDWGDFIPKLQEFLANVTLPPAKGPLFPRPRAIDLPRLSIDKTQTSISGMSSGGYMTVQVHFSHSKTFPKGAGVLTGGPLNCAMGGMNQCWAGTVPIDMLEANARDWASRGLIDPLENMAAQKVYIFVGRNDFFFGDGIMRSTNEFYKRFVPSSNIKYHYHQEAGHGFVVEHFGVWCPIMFFPFINRCDVDTIGELLQHIYGPLNPKKPDNQLSGRSYEIDQKPFNVGTAMSDTGYLYVPDACRLANANCRLHVVLHGCMQTHEIPFVNDIVQRRAGYNNWADANRIVVLYPQTSLLAQWGCWDFVGWSSTNFANKLGPQITSIKRMVDHLSN